MPVQEGRGIGPSVRGPPKEGPGPAPGKNRSPSPHSFLRRRRPTTRSDPTIAVGGRSLLGAGRPCRRRSRRAVGFPLARPRSAAGRSPGTIPRTGSSSGKGSPTRMLTVTLLLALISANGAEAPAAAPVLLDFHSGGCGPCRDMRPAVELGADPQEGDIPVKSIDVEQSPDLAAKYRVTHVPSFIVVDRDGRVLDRLEGARPARELAMMYRSANARLVARREEQAAWPRREADRRAERPRAGRGGADRRPPPLADGRPHRHRGMATALLRASAPARSSTARPTRRSSSPVPTSSR